MTTISRPVNTSPFYGYQLRKFTIRALLSLLVFFGLVIYLMPLGNMLMTALRDTQNLSTTQEEPIYPTKPKTFNYKGQDIPIYKVPQESGEVKEMALVKGTRAKSTFVDPANPDAGEIEWKGNYRSLEPVLVFSARWENFAEAWDKINFPLLFRNTLVIAVVGMIGTLLSSICVAYAFARFPIPGKNILFIVLIGTIILPSQVTLIPTYAFFRLIGWIGTWLPLIVPHFFANAYNVFLLRQYFMTLPKDLDEAAMIDGAGPFQILTRVIIPQSWPAIISVAVFHFIFAWNDFFGPLVYLGSKPDLQPISVGVQVFSFQYGPRPDLIQATSLMAMLLPLVIFFAAQRVFMRGVVITGVEK